MDDLPLEVVSLIAGKSRYVTIVLRLTCARFSTLVGDWDILYQRFESKKPQYVDMAQYCFLDAHHDCYESVTGVLCGDMLATLTAPHSKLEFGRDAVYRMRESCLHELFRQISREMMIRGTPDELVLFCKMVLIDDIYLPVAHVRAQKYPDYKIQTIEHNVDNDRERCSVIHYLAPAKYIHLIDASGF